MMLGFKNQLHKYKYVERGVRLEQMTVSQFEEGVERVRWGPTDDRNEDLDRMEGT